MMFITVESHCLRFYQDKDLLHSVRLAVDPAVDTTTPSRGKLLFLVRFHLVNDLALVLGTHLWDDAMCSSSVDDYAADHEWPWGQGMDLRKLMEEGYDAH